MKTRYFTFAYNSENAGTTIEITAKDPRAIMFKVFGEKWAFEYDSLEKVHPMDRCNVAKITVD